MATTYKSLTALGLSTTLLGLAACGNETPPPSDPVNEQVATSTDELAATPTTETAPPTTAMVGEGEGGEGGEGEGGEGGVNLAAAGSDPAVYRSALAVVEAHMRAGIDALMIGERRAAGEMFAHPVSEILFEFEPVLKQQGVAPFEQKLIDASGAVFQDESAEAIKARVDDIIATLRRAGDAAPQSDETDAVVTARVITDEIDRAISQYRAARNSEAYEPYLDGYGFYKTAEALMADNEAAIQAEAPDFADQAAEALALLGAAYPSARQPDALDADVSELTVANSELQLIVSGL